MRISLISLKNWYCRKKRNVVSASMLQEHSGFKVSSKLSRNLCSNPNLNLISNLSTWSWMLKIFVYRDQVCFIPLWQTVKNSFVYILDPKIQRMTCISMSCGSSNGWKKAIDIFRDFLWKPYKINTVISSTVFDANAIKLIPGINFLGMIFVWLQWLLMQP